MLESLRSEELRTLVLEGLKRRPTGSSGALHSEIADLQRTRQVATTTTTTTQGPGVQMMGGREQRLNDNDQWRVQDVFWDLLIEGLVRPGYNDHNQDLPWYHLTEKGKEAVKGVDPSPYDPDGYLNGLKKDVPELDPVIFKYLTECLHTFRIGCLLSSAVTLGCASEKALLLLVDACSAALPSGPQREGFIKKTAGKMISVQHDEFLKMFNGHFRGLVKKGELGEHIDTAVDYLFTLFRDQRNDAGHPSGADVRRAVVHAHITTFPLYLSEVYSLIRWFQSNRPL